MSFVKIEKIYMDEHCYFNIMDFDILQYTGTIPFKACNVM
jgi:hypothetical protein